MGIEIQDIFRRFIIVTAFISIFIFLSKAQKQPAYVRQYKKYIIAQLGLNVGKGFYSEFEKDTGFYYYVYASKANAIALPDTMKGSFFYMGRSAAEAIVKAKVWAVAGYDTLVYRTAGTSAAMLNSKLLGYCRHNILFIMLHEAVHVHLKRSQIKIPYAFEESLGDLLGNYGAMFSGLVDYEKSRAMTVLNEQIYRFLIQCSTGEISGEARQHHLNELMKHADSFRIDRFQYAVNNAYLLRNQFYTQRYFLLKHIFFPFPLD